LPPLLRFPLSKRAVWQLGHRKRVYAIGVAKAAGKLPHSTKFFRKNYARMNSRNKPNGHGALLANGASSATISSRGVGRAASDDASDLSVANATASSAAAGAERDANADVAPPQGERRRPHTGEAAAQLKLEKDGKNAGKEVTAQGRRKLRRGLTPLPVDGEAFVDAVHKQVDLVRLEVDLLSSLDDKIVQRELAYLRELRYGKHAPASDDGPQIILDMQQPERESS